MDDGPQAEPILVATGCSGRRTRALHSLAALKGATGPAPAVVKIYSVWFSAADSWPSS